MQNGWTVLFFIYAEDDETQGYARSLIRILKQTQHHEDLVLLAFHSKFSETGGGIIDGKLFNLRFDATAGMRREHLEHDFGEVNPGKSSVLASVLSYVKDNELLKEKFLLFTWDHGTGFGIFDGDPTEDGQENFADTPVKSLLPQTKGAQLKVITNRHTDFFLNKKSKKLASNLKGLMEIDGIDTNAENDTKSEMRLDMLTLTEINQALKVLGQKTELVIMLNCWMQMLENSLELEDTVNWLVAAETVHFFAGYDYKLIIDTIAGNPHRVTGEHIARTTVESLPGVFLNDPEWDQNLKEVVVTAVQPGQVARVITALNTICDELVQNIPGNFKHIIHCRTGSLDLSKGYFLDAQGNANLSVLIYCIDILDFVAALQKQNLVSAASFNKFKDAVAAFTRFTCVGDNFKRQNPNTGLPFGHGVSIYHPDTADDFTMMFYNFFYASQRIRMAKAGWGTYLEAYKKNR